MTAERVGLFAAALVVTGGLAGGFALIGSPPHQRELELDRRRVADLAEAAGALQRRFHPGDDGTQISLPAALPRDLVVQYVNRAVETTDPRDHRAYVYVRESPTRYRLCATFALPSASGDGGYGDGWPHGAGPQCYRFDVTRGAEPQSPSE